MEKNVERFVSGIITSIENIVITKSDNDLEIGTNSIETTICLDGKETYKLANGINLNKNQKIGLYLKKDAFEVEYIIDNEKKLNFLLRREKMNKLYLYLMLAFPLILFFPRFYGLPLSICILSLLPILICMASINDIKNASLSKKDKKNIENYLNTMNVENNKEKQKVIKKNRK